MKMVFTGVAIVGLLSAASLAFAQDTTVVHKDVGPDHSKTVVKHADGEKTVIKRGRHHVKKVHIAPNGDKTVVKKTTPE